MLFLKELCSQSANCSRTSPKTELSVTNSLVYVAVARQSAHEAHMRKASGIMQMRQTRQMQINEDACIRNWTDKIATPETCNLSAATVILTTPIQRLCGSLWLYKDGAPKPQEMVAPQTKELVVRETEGLRGENSWARRSSWTKYRSWVVDGWCIAVFKCVATFQVSFRKPATNDGTYLWRELWREILPKILWGFVTMYWNGRWHMCLIELETGTKHFESRVFIENWQWSSQRWGSYFIHPGKPWEFPSL